MKFRIGTRGSYLARVQARTVAARLEEAGHETELVIISTAGDRSNAPSFAAIGTLGVFVREIERALVAGEIDLAVHSYKDLPTASPEALTIAAVPARMDPADILIVRSGENGGAADAVADEPLLPVPAGARIGTASARRQSWLRHFRPDVRPESLRGNVLTRIRRLQEERCDAILLAAAGLERLRASAPGAAELEGARLDDIDVMRLDPALFVPAPAQGALAVQCRRADERRRELLAPLDEPAARLAIDAERALLARMEGGCELPFGAYCERESNDEHAPHVMVAMVALDERGGEVRRETLRGADPLALADELWERLMVDEARARAGNADG